ncbi:short chain dehydrogenase [Klebsiella michiganensis]|nr:short chain dehydrogenase [Klebsiella michiganensis]
MAVEAALTYSRYSASVILVGRNEEKLRSVAHEIQQAGGIPARWFTLDLLTCTPQECQQLAQKIAIHYPRLDGVLHNAGLLGDVCPMVQQKPEVWQQVMQVNVNGTFMLTQALLPLLLESESGSLVFTSSSGRPPGTRELGRVRRVEIRHRGHDAGAGRGVSEPSSAGQLH